MRARFRWLFRGAACLALSLAVARPLCAADALADPDRWFPRHLGDSWDYEIARQASFQPTGQPPEELVFRGTTTVAVSSVRAEYGASEATLETTVYTQLSPTPAPPPLHLARTTYTARSARGLFLHASGRRTGTSPAQASKFDDGFVRYDPPVRLVAFPITVGQTWEMGEMYDGGLIVTLTARIAGFEDVTTPAGVFRHCLKIARTGSISGRGNAGNTMGRPLQAGSIERLEWIAAGVGSVKQWQQRTEVYTDPASHGPMTFHETTTKTLTQYKVARS